MNSTSDDPHADELRRFFDEQLMPAARQRLASRGPSFAVRPDPEAKTYFAARAKTRASASDLELSSLRDEAAVASALQAFWTARGEPELAALAGELSRLAIGLRSVETPTDEVSPFIYVMF